MTEIEVIEHTANDEEMEDQIGTLHDVVIHRDNSTEPEAAHYCCVSYSQFRDKRLESGIPMIQFMGKRIYRRSDLEAAIEGRSRR